MERERRGRGRVGDRRGRGGGEEGERSGRGGERRGRGGGEEGEREMEMESIHLQLITSLQLHIRTSSGEFREGLEILQI